MYLFYSLRFWLVCSCSLIIFSCQDEKRHLVEDGSDVKKFHKSVQLYTSVIVDDIFSPPVASRNYVYPAISAYEVSRMVDSSKYLSFAGQLNGLDSISCLATSNICLPLAATYAFLYTGKHFISSKYKIENQIDIVLDYYSDKGLSKSIIDQSIEAAKNVSDQIIIWASKDGYRESRSYGKFTTDGQTHTWKPTPPAYMDGIEPHWNTIRPFVLDSSTQFVPPPPTPFSQSTKSPFYKEIMQVYDAVKFADEEQFEIAHFWDCNPYKVNVSGHVMHATKKITPGGHWVNITGISAQSANANMAMSSAAYALTAIAIADGFISCWDEKYRSRLVRPETVINNYIDESWRPLLQTPPFPEYTSGHSVISTAAAEVLTHIFGENFQFEDDTEVVYGLPVRSYNSFKEASQEAAISRLYGGIHYLPAIENGVKQGSDIGKLVIDRIELIKVDGRGL